MKRLACAGLLLAASLPVHAGPNVKEGQWEMTMKMEMDGKPVPMPAQSIKYCVTKESLVPKPKGTETNSNCSKVEPKVTGDTVSWEVTCKEAAQTIESRGRITYKGDTFDGVIDSKMTGNGRTSNMKQVMSGRRIGECKQ